MAGKKIIPIIYLKNQLAYEDRRLVKAFSVSPLELAVTYAQNGADEIVVWDFSDDDASHEAAIGILRQISKAIDIPLLAGGNTKRVEDVKKYLYAGASVCLLEDCRESNLLLMKEVCSRFGKEKIGLRYTGNKEALNMAMDYEINLILCNEDFKEDIRSTGSIFLLCETAQPPEMILKDFDGITGCGVNPPDYDFMAVKNQLKKEGFAVNIFESAISFSDFKLNEAGLIPVIVQDYKTDEVLMMAYMNEEAFETTVRTGKMTYYSRSRQELWVKGNTSGHFQYVKSMEIDCDNDTLLAKVHQIGAACHTGNRSCFYRNLFAQEYAQVNPLKVLNNVMSVIENRKVHPKEGSYTNYLFDKGIDKILKKVGEECTEIVIASKNPDSEEVKYEISDFLYHIMVLMSLKELTWDDIVKELANR